MFSKYRNVANVPHPLSYKQLGLRVAQLALTRLLDYVLRSIAAKVAFSTLR